MATHSKASCLEDPIDRREPDGLHSVGSEESDMAEEVTHAANHTSNLQLLLNFP